MLVFGSFAFATPAVLLALAALPVIWWLVRVTPPAPRRIFFPAIRLLLGLRPRDEEPARTPLWLMALRLALAALLIFAFAGPLLHPRGKLAQSGPIVLVVDNGWAAAEDWSARQSALFDILSEARRESRKILLLPTAAAAGEEPPLVPMPAAAARAALRALTPEPWPVDRVAALARLKAVALPRHGLAIWLCDGIDGSGEGKGASALADYLAKHAVLRILGAGTAQPPLLLAPGKPEAKELAVKLESLPAPQPRVFYVRANGEDGRLLARRAVNLEPGKSQAAVSLPMPNELRNKVAGIEIEGVRSAGAVLLADERWHRRPVGIVVSPRPAAAPLLSARYYLERALGPVTDVRTGSASELLERPLAVLVYRDGGPDPTEAAKIRRWVVAGGLLLRFAGPLLADGRATLPDWDSRSNAGAREGNSTAPGDRLLPVQLRRGGRTLGGALSWERPATLAPFGPHSPFAGLAVPPDLTVSRQVLAEPDIGLDSKIWARLADGTPLVTAARMGRGWLVLVHTTANASWSNLALSGLFVEMLRRIIAMSEGFASVEGAALAPLETLDGFGRLGRPPPTARPITAKGAVRSRVSPQHPPGFYGSARARRALNLASAIGELQPTADLPPGIRPEGFAKSGEIALGPPLLAAATALALVDFIVAYALRGLLWRRGRRFAAAILLALSLEAQGAHADDAFDIRATARLHLAYVATGDEEVDRISRAGLLGLGLILDARTAVDPGAPEAIDIERDPLVFFPLIYWPVTASEPPPSPQAVKRINHYLETGGTILIDTRDGGERTIGPFAGAGESRLRRLLAGIKIPSLVPIPPDHILTKSFYLLREFPGRWNGGTLWVEPAQGWVNDGVSSVILGDNDWAAAWAVDPQGRPIFPVVPGGAQQREMARRFGVNLVMYVLTGNYKNDQLQVPEILRRLGR